jgi:hypothetical protein
VSPGLFSIVAAAVAVASSANPATSPTGRRAVALGDLPAVAVSGPARRIELGNNGPVDGLAWLAGGRLAVVTAQDAVLHVLEPSGLRSARWELRARALAVVGSGPTAIVLVAPADRAGTARLVLLDATPSAHPRTVRLPGIRAGMRPHEGDARSPWTPGMVVARDGRVIVVGSRRIAWVTPRTGAVRIRRPAGLSPARVRVALALRGGREIAIAGPDLLYLDVASGRLRRVAAKVDAVDRWRGGVLSSGFSTATAWDAAGRQVFHRRLRTTEFVAPTADGRRLVLARLTSNGVEVRRTLNP